MRAPNKKHVAENEYNPKKRGRKREPDLKGIRENRLDYIEFLLIGYLSGDFDSKANGRMAPFARFPYSNKNVCRQKRQAVELQHDHQGGLHGVGRAYPEG